MSRHERLNQLSFYNAMEARLADQMHINEQILLIDDDFNAISLLEVWQPLRVPYSHGHKSWLPFACVDPSLSASHFLDRAKENTIPEKQLRVNVFRT
jgi:hypothetical protein